MKKFSCYLIFTLLFCGHLSAKVLHVTKHGFIVENVIVTEQSSAAVWSALVDNIDDWWPKDHSWWGEQGTFSIGAKAGGCFCEIADVRSAEHMRISFVAPQELLRMTGGLGPLQGMGVYGSLDWDFSKVDGKTQVILTYSVTGIHEGGFETIAPIVAKVQAEQLSALKAFVESSN